MISETIKIKNSVGLHARPATFFIQKANSYKCSIWVEKEDCRVNAKSLLGVLSLGISKGTRVGFMFRNCFEYAEIFYAIQKLGAVAVPYCFAFKANELIYNLKNSECTYFIYDKKYVDLVNSIKEFFF